MTLRNIPSGLPPTQPGGAIKRLDIVIAGGLAATFAESISMGAVAYTSTLAEHDYYRSGVERERREIREIPEAQAQEARHVFSGRGFEGYLLEQAVASR